jgi:hypothetical protein
MKTPQRRSPRIPLDGEVTITSESVNFKGSLANMSLHGVLIETGERMPLGEAAVLTFWEPDTRDPRSVIADAVVVRHDEIGVAFDLRRMDLDSLILLRSMVRYTA